MLEVRIRTRIHAVWWGLHKTLTALSTDYFFEFDSFVGIEFVFDVDFMVDLNFF